MKKGNIEILKKNRRYKEIRRLNKLLKKASIPHTMERLFDGWRICYPSAKNCTMDAIEHFGSYGEEKDLIEIMGLLTAEEQKIDCVVGYLSATDVFERIKQHYEKSKNEEAAE